MYDFETEVVVSELPAPPWVIDSWSNDGRYLALIMGDGPIPPEISIWDAQLEQGVAQLGGIGVIWSDQGSRFLYQVHDAETRTDELRMYDLATGTGHPVTRGAPGGLDFDWAPGARYVVIDDGTREALRFRVHDLVEGRDAVILLGVLYVDWLDDDTLGVVGDACSQHAYYSVDVDGSNLRKLVQFESLAVPHLSPQRDRIGWSLREEDGRFVTTVMDLATGETREYETGDAVLPPYRGGEYWSPDGRYLALIKPGGRDGICFSQEPQELEVEVR